MDELSILQFEAKKNDVIEQLDRVSDYFPGVLIVHELPTLNLVYMSSRGLRELDMTLEQLKSLGSEYNYKYFNQIDALDYIPKVAAMLERNSIDELVSFFQQMRSKPEDSYRWHISTSKILLRDPNGSPALAITIAQPIDALHNITSKLDKIISDNDFFRMNCNKFNTLTKRELQILRLMGDSKSAIETSQLLFISLHTVESHRKNIRKKLNIKNNSELQLYITAFNL